MITHHLIRRKDFEFAASDSVVVFAEGAVVEEVPPTEIQIIGGEQSVSITENTEYTTFRTASDSIIVFAEGAVVDSQGPTQTTIIGGEQSVSLTESTEYTIFRTASDSITVFTEGAVVGTQGPGSVTIIGGEQAVNLTETSSYEFFRTASDSISVFTEGAVVNTQSASTTIIGGEQSVSLTESTNYGVGTDPIASLDGTFIGSTSINWDACGSSDPTGQQLEYRFDWNNTGTYDTGWSTDCAQTHVYDGPGPKTCKVQVRDPDGNTDTATDTVNI